MAVDTEERVNYDRLRSYRLGRARAALEASELGALLLFDVNNIRYTTSTAIGEWSRDKMTRYALLTRGGEPMVWDFGSAAKHHRQFCPWLHEHNVHAGLTGLRGAIGPESGLFEKAALQIHALLRKPAWRTCRWDWTSSSRRFSSRCRSSASRSRTASK
jgi:hypothetical protein